MKKNRMMRLASVLLVCVLLTTSIISGTFAKYVTTAEANDNARVAKWGITMDVNGKGTFVDTYDTNKVIASDKTADAEGSALVAPGTKGSATYSVSGAPETAYIITFEGLKQNDVFLANGLKYKYVDADDSNGTVAYTKPGTSIEAAVTADYYPIYYTVTVTAANAEFGKADTAKDAITATGTAQNFDTLEAALAALNNTKLTYEPNEEANLTVKIDWEWKFDNTTTVTNMTEINDVYDTILGDIAAKNVDLTVDNVTGANLEATVANKYDTTIAFKLAMTATQVD